VTSSRGCSSSLAVFILTGLACLHTATPRAAEVYVADASSEGPRYRVNIEALVSAPEPDVRSLLTDYAHLGRINPAIKISEILLQRKSGDLRVRTVTDVCVWFYCKRIHQVQDVTQDADGSVSAVVIPEQSDFRYGVAHLALKQEANGTRVLIRGELEPDFWIPPLIGRWMIRDKLIEEALVIIENLERVAPLPALPHNSEPSDTP
jgi:hypothetical protein